MPAFVETQFPIARLSVESYKVRLIGEDASQALSLGGTLREAYEEAEEFCRLLQLRVKGAGFFKTLLLRRLGSSMKAGRNTVMKLLSAAVDELDSDNDDDVDDHYRDAAKGMLPAPVVSLPSATIKLPAESAVQGHPPKPWPPLTSLGSVPVTYKAPRRRKHKSNPGAAATPADAARDQKPAPISAKQVPPNQPATLSPSERQRSQQQRATMPPETRQPLTNMALAFQKLALSDSEAQEALISGFRSQVRRP